MGGTASPGLATGVYLASSERLVGPRRLSHHLLSHCQNLPPPRPFENFHFRSTQLAMPEATFPKDALKQALKEALIETISEHQDLLRAVVADVLEDLAFGEAMYEGEATEIVGRVRIFDLLEGRT